MKPKSTEDHLQKLMNFPGQWLRIRGGPNNETIKSAMDQVKVALDLMQVPYEVRHKQMRVIELEKEIASSTSALSTITGRIYDKAFVDDLMNDIAGVPIESFMEILKPIPKNKVEKSVYIGNPQRTSNRTDEEHHSGLRTFSYQFPWHGDPLL